MSGSTLDHDPTYRLIFNATSNMMAFTEFETGKILDVNNAWVRTTGIRREDAIGKTALDHGLWLTGSDRNDIIGDLHRTGVLAARDVKLFVGGEVRTFRTSAQVVRADNSSNILWDMHDVTDERRAQNSVAEFARNFEAFLDQTTDFIYFKDIESRIRFCSQTLAEITGHRHWRDMIGKHDREIFPPDIARIYEEEELPVFQTGRPLLNREDPYYDAAGNKRYVQTNKWPLFDQRNNVVGIFGISRDITESKALQDALLQAESRFRELVEQSPQAIQIVEPSGRVSVVNKSWEKLWGVPFDALASYNMFTDKQLIDKGVTPQILAVLDGEIPPPITIDYNRAGTPEVTGSGGVITVVTSMYPRKDKQGKVCEIVLLQEDVTDRVRIERELRSRTTAFVTSPAGVLVRDSSGRIVDCNESACAMLEQSRQQLLGSNQPPPGWTLSDDKGSAEADLRQLLVKGQTVRGLLLKVAPPQGVSRWLSVNIEPLVDPRTEGLVGSVTAFVDVSSLQDLAETRRLAGTVFDHVSEAIIVTNRNNEIIAVNPAFTKITGYEQEAAVGKNPHFLSSGVHPRDFYMKMWEAMRRNGHWSGEIVNRRSNGQIYPEWLTISVVRDSNGAVVNHVALFSDISERKTNEERLHRLAHFDYLTGLPNRLLLNERLAVAIEEAGNQGHRMAVLFVDIDNFKLINDSLGHGIGDKVLVAVASRMAKCLKAGDTLSRYSGDEFVVLLAKIRESADASIVANRLIDSLKSPFGFDDQELHVSCSIGISIFSDDGGSIPDLLRNADAAMYRAKKRGRKRIEYFSPDLAATAQTQVRLHNLLRRAIDANDINLHYQPQFDTNDRRLVGMEALARWRQDGKWISPGEFIPAAEKSGLIVELGNQLLRCAFQDIAAWRSQGLVVPKVGINISVRHFEQNDFVDVLTNYLDEYGIGHSDIELEVTESVFAEDERLVQQTIQTIRKLGVDVAIDDFGTGYSSLSYLKALSISRLKIDQSFIRGLPQNGSDVAIVIAVVNMAKALGIDVIAEGVETEEQFGFLHANGCNQVQGYLLGKPMAVDEIANLLPRKRSDGSIIPR